MELDLKRFFGFLMMSLGLLLMMQGINVMQLQIYESFYPWVSLVLVMAGSFLIAMK